MNPDSHGAVIANPDPSEGCVNLLPRGRCPPAGGRRVLLYLSSENLMESSNDTPRPSGTPLKGRGCEMRSV